MFDHFEQLSLACHGTGAGLVLSRLDSLEKLITQHFETEERLMSESGYPDIEVQRREHKEFFLKVGEFRRMADCEGASRRLGAQVAGSMVQWIVRHIRHHDSDLARYINLRQTA
jgi:hemerythrin